MSLAGISLLKSTLKNHRWFLLLIALTWGVYFGYLFTHMIEVRLSGLYVGHEHAWSDWALHISQANIFAFKPMSLWFDYHPLYAGGKFTYPFLTNFISGMLMRLGFSLPQAFIIPSLIFVAGLLMGIYFLLYLLLKSKIGAVFGLTFYFLSSGMGFWQFLIDQWHSPSWAALAYPVKDFSRNNFYEWYAGNVVVGLLVPQRAFLLGLTLGIWVLISVIYVLTKTTLEQQQQRKVLLVAGIVAGILPIAHTHSFIVIVILSGLISMAYFKKWRLLLWYVIPAGLVSVTLYWIFIHGGIQNAAFFRWNPGWTAPGGFISWVTMWWLLWGTMIPAAALGFATLAPRISPAGRRFFWGCGVLFVIANLILLQPVRWDNTKIFWWVYLGFSGLAACAVLWFWSNGRMGKVIAALLVFSLTATGTLELVRMIRVDRHEFQVTGREDMDLGLEIRASTDPRARFLTAPQHNHFIMVWALRPILLGYTAWVWNYGFSYQQRERDVHQMYTATGDVENLLRKYEVSYVVVGPVERHDFNPDEEYYAMRFPLAFYNSNYQIYDTRRVLLEQ